MDDPTLVDYLRFWDTGIFLGVPLSLLRSHSALLVSRSGHVGVYHFGLATIEWNCLHFVGEVSFLASPP